MPQGPTQRRNHATPLGIFACGCIVMLASFGPRLNTENAVITRRKLPSTTLAANSDEWVRQPSDLVQEISRNYNDEMGSTTLPIASDTHLDPRGRAFVPPLFIRPAQNSNNLMDFTEQVLRYNLNAYQTSPPFSATPSPESRIVHFVYLTEPPNTTVMRLIDYLVIRSVFLRYQPHAIYLHMNQLPDDSCPYWNLIKPMITVIPTDLVYEIYGKKITGLSHMSDVTRLQAVLKYGGLYMDTDMIAVRPLPDELWDPPSHTMVGFQRPKTLGSAIFAARKNSPFLTHWLENFRDFNDEDKADTIEIATKVYLEHPEEVDVVPPELFYKPTWTKTRELFRSNAQDYTSLPSFTKNYAIHYWNSVARKRGYKTEKMSVADVLQENSGLNQVLRTLLPSPFISISISCQSGIPAVREALDSVLAQDFPLWEILILEDEDADTFDTLHCREFVFDEFVPQQDRLRPFGRRYISFVPASMQVKELSQSVWHVHLEGGKQLEANALMQSVQKMAESPMSTEFSVGAGDLKLEFIYNASRPLLPVKSPVSPVNTAF